MEVSVDAISQSEDIVPGAGVNIVSSQENPEKSAAASEALVNQTKPDDIAKTEVSVAGNLHISISLRLTEVFPCSERCLLLCLFNAFIIIIIIKMLKKVLQFARVTQPNQTTYFIIAPEIPVSFQDKL